MARWEPNTEQRLIEAALDLFAERGFEATTVEDIATRAGLTKRTFFRYFPDKREVLFPAGSAFSDLIVDGLAAAPPSAAPLEAAGAGLEAAGAMLQERRPFARRRHRVVAANPGLQERELVKLAAVGTAVAAALRDRGVPEPAASLTAETALAVFRVAFEQWATAEGDEDLPTLIRSSLDALRTVTAR